MDSDINPAVLKKGSWAAVSAFTARKHCASDTASSPLSAQMTVTSLGTCAERFSSPPSSR